MQSQVQKSFNILNKDFLMACQLEAIGQLKEKGITEAEIMANPKLFAQKVYEVAELFKSIEASFNQPTALATR